MWLIASKYFFAFLFIVISSPALGRFLHTDADEIDSELAIESEYFNDEISYQPPLWLTRKWRHSDNGFRLGAGSYNAKQFNYFEEIKFQTQSTDYLQLSFHRQVEQTLIEDRSQGMVQVGFYHPAGVGLLVFADGDGRKQNEDLGVGVELVSNAYLVSTLRYWSVDHYYNTKALEKEAHDERSPTSISLEVIFNQPREQYLKVLIEHDDKMKRSRPLIQKLYEYEASRIEVEADLYLNGAFSGLANTKMEQKRESLTIESPLESKSLNRRLTETEVGVEWRDRPYSSLEAGLGLITRNSNFEFPRFSSMTESAPVYEPDYRHQEKYIKLLRNQSYSKGRNIITYGFYLNMIDSWRDEAHRDNFESKFRLSWDITIEKQGSIVLNSTWDIDQLQRGFPYQEKSFRPWGGGSIQFHLVL